MQMPRYLFSIWGHFLVKFFKILDFAQNGFIKVIEVADHEYEGFRSIAPSCEPAGLFLSLQAHIFKQP